MGPGISFVPGVAHKLVTGSEGCCFDVQIQIRYWHSLAKIDSFFGFPMRRMNMHFVVQQGFGSLELPTIYDGSLLYQESRHIHRIITDSLKPALHLTFALDCQRSAAGATRIPAGH